MNPSDLACGPRPRAYSPWWRLVAALGVAVSRASLPAMLLALVLSRGPVGPLPLFRTVALFAVLPACAAWLVGIAMRVTITVAGGRLTIERLGLRVEVPGDAIARVAPWRLPLPGPGLSLVLASDRRLRQTLQAADPTAILACVAAAGAPDAAATAERHPMVVWAREKAAAGPWRWYHLVAKFPLFALGPTLVLFRAHQHIAYGGTWGEWYLLGPRAYLVTFAIHWTTVTIYQALWASVWRGLAEAAALGAAAVAPSRAARVRRVAEIACRILYYGGVPALVALRFAPW